MSDSQLIDVSGALARLGGSSAILKKILGSFLAGDEFSNLRTAIESGDAEVSARAAHTIKGVAGNLSLTALYEASISLETDIKENGTAGVDLAAFEALWHRTRTAVQETVDTM